MTVGAKRREVFHAVVRMVPVHVMCFQNTRLCVIATFSAAIHQPTPMQLSFDGPVSASLNQTPLRHCAAAFSAPFVYHDPLAPEGAVFSRLRPRRYELHAAMACDGPRVAIGPQASRVARCGPTFLAAIFERRGARWNDPHPRATLPAGQPLPGFWFAHIERTVSCLS